MEKIILQKSDLLIILFDSNIVENEIQNLHDYTTRLVISFDYESHKRLLKNKIEHVVSNNFLLLDDIESIQGKSYHISQWFLDEKIMEFLKYEGINLGQLYRTEFHYLLVPFLTKFVEFIRIFNKYPDATYVASGILYNIVSSFTSNVIKSVDQKNTDKFLYDSVEIPFKLGSKSIPISISRNRYMKIKNVTEKILHHKLLQKNINKGILLVEFDSLRYQKFLEQSLQHSLNFFLFNRRRPNIWNYNSYKILKNSKSVIITENDLINNNLHNFVEKQIESVTKKIDTMLDDQFFSTFFSFDGVSFWNPIKDIFADLTKKRIIEAVYEIELAKQAFEKFTFSCVLVWSEIGFNEQITIILANQKKIPVILLQHGMYYDTNNSYEFNKLAGIFPFLSDRFIAWGKIIQKYMIESGLSEEKILPLGSLFLDRSFEMKGKSDDYVLLATSSPIGHFANDLTVKTREKYEEAIKKICQAVLKLNKKLVIKMHPSSEELDITELVNNIDPKIPVMKTGDFTSLVQSCELFVTIDFSTTMLEAQIFQKPVISVSVKEYGFREPSIFRYNSCVLTNTDNFENSVAELLSNSNHRKQIIENGNRFVNDYLSNQGNATRKLLEFLEEKYGNKNTLINEKGGTKM